MKSLIDTVLADKFLGDEHMTIVHELLHAQYPHLGGLQPTIFSQNNGFCPVKSTVDSIQIHYTGHSRWVVSAYMKSVDRICIYDCIT